MLRRVFVLVHRWLGLATAVFLFLAGLTGALLAWNPEIDRGLNPALFEAPGAGPALPVPELVRRIEAADPRLRLTYFPLALQPGEAFNAFVAPRVDAAGRTPELGFDQVFADPATGALLGHRDWGAFSLAREQLVPFLYELHYSLQLPAIGGLQAGTLFMGIVACAWVIDTLVALWLAFPSRAAWRRSFAFRWRDGGHKLVFDLHRSGGAWLFALVLVVAVTSVAMNLSTQVVRPLVSLFSTLSPSAWDGRASAPPGKEPVLAVTLPQAIAVAEAEARRRGWTRPAGGASVAAGVGLYGIGFFGPGGMRGEAGLGNPWIHVDARSGAVVHVDEPGTGSAGDVFLQAMFPLHSGRIAGTAGRVAVTLLGLAIAGFAVTGVLVWARKRRARRLARAPGRAAALGGAALAAPPRGG